MNTNEEITDYSSLGLRELQKLAKTTEDTQLQLEIAHRGNAAALKNLARNKLAVTSALMAAYHRTEDSSLKKEIALNLNSSVYELSSYDLALALYDAYKSKSSYKITLRSDRERYEKRYEFIINADWMDDERLNSISSYLMTKQDGKTVLTLILVSIISNLSNQLSEDKLLELVKYPTVGRLVFQYGRVPVNRLHQINKEYIYLDSVQDQELLSIAAFLLIAGRWYSPEEDMWGKPDEYGRYARKIADSLVENPRTPTEALTMLAKQCPIVDDKKLYNHPNVSADIKQKLADSSPEVQSQLRVQKALGSRSMEELRNELIIGGEVVNTNRGYHKTDLQLDAQKIGEYGLTKMDIEAIMQEGHPFYSYDPETSRYGGSYDTSG